jgi:IclR family transcriptional regulator, KDG regulon repressor
MPVADTIAGRRARSATLEKALQLLYVVAAQPDPISLVALSRAAELDKATTHRLATSLTRYGLLRFDPLARSYSLGLRLVELGNRAIAQLDLEIEARPYLQQLGKLSGEAIHLGVFDQGEVVYVARVSSEHPVIIRARVGTRALCHCTGMGKVLLAFGPPERLETALNHFGLHATTPNTITSSEELAEHLARVRRLGYAVDDEENRLGVRCLAAPVFDHSGVATAAISIAGPAFRLSREQLDELVDPLIDAANKLSALLGFGPNGRTASHSSGRS